MQLLQNAEAAPHNGHDSPERAAIKLRFLHANLGGTADWPIRFTGTHEHTPELCRLLNELQDEIERAGHPTAPLQIHCEKAATNKA